MGLCHPKPLAPKKTPPLDDEPPVCATDARGPPPASRQETIDRGHCRRLLDIAGAAAKLADEGDYLLSLCCQESAAPALLFIWKIKKKES